MYMEDDDFDGLVRTLKNEVELYPEQEEARIEKQLWENHKNKHKSKSNTKKRKRNKTKQGESMEQQQDEAFKKNRKNVKKAL